VRNRAVGSRADAAAHRQRADTRVGGSDPERSGIGGALIAYALALNVLLWKKKRRFPFHGKVYFFSLLGYLVAEAIGTRYFATSAQADNSVVVVVRGLVTLLIWVPYLTRSRRVAETFVRP
jgi:hypothetical protein